MKTKKENNIPLYYFEQFMNEDGLLHYVSTKGGGISSGQFESMNLGYRVGDNPELVRFNRFKLAGELGLHNDRLIFPRQTHSDIIKVIDYNFLLLDSIRKQKYLENTDALITKDPHICINVLVADCVPVIFYDKIKSVIAVAHAGWQGSLQKIVSKTASKLIDNFLCAPKNIKVGIGPCISSESYVVREDLYIKFKKEFNEEVDNFIIKIEEDKYNLDLVALTKIQLLEKGIAEENIETSNICTYNAEKDFFSHRRDKGVTGRFACGIMLK